MRTYILLLLLSFSCILANAQCTPNSLYQDSTYNIWPDTIQNLPHVDQGVNYNTTIDLKTPMTLIEASGGDSLLTTIDTLGNSYYIGDWPVDSMVMVNVLGLPTGINMDCNTSNCVFEGNEVGCANVYGITNDNFGTYPITIEVNVYTHGSLTIFGFPVPVSTDLYSALGSYETIDGYKLVVNSPTSINDHKHFTSLSNFPNPSNGITNIEFNYIESANLIFTVKDIFGRLVFSDNILTKVGLNKYEFDYNLPSGVYIYSLEGHNKTVSNKMIVAGN